MSKRDATPSSLGARFKCEECPASYTTAVNLRAHVAAKHPVDKGIVVMLEMVGKNGSTWRAAATMTRPQLCDKEDPALHLDEAGILREGLRVTGLMVVTP